MANIGDAPGSAASCILQHVTCDVDRQVFGSDSLGGIR